MIRIPLLALWALLAGMPGAFGQCTIDPGKDFFQNFDNSCYAIPFAASAGSQLAGDSNARYGLAYFKVNPRYELIVYGTFLQARYFSIAVNDDHDALTSSIYDQRIQPLTASDKNPYQTAATFTPGQRFAVTVSEGGVQPSSGSIQPGCSVAAYNIHGNVLAGNIRHAGIDWTGDPNLPRNFPPHIGAPPVGGTVLVRTYLPAEDPPPPVKLLVRDLATGCAITAAEAQTLQLASTDASSGANGNDKDQVLAHVKYANTVQSQQCYQVVSDNVLRWQRNAEYIPGINPDAVYLRADVTSDVKRKMTNLLSDTVLRIRMRVPVTPKTPCPGCGLNGTEQLRYWSMSFMNGAKTITSLSDENVVKDPNGWVTVIVRIGGKPPVNATAANGYTYIDINTFAGVQLTAINIRSLLATAGFACHAGNIPFLTTEDNPAGGYMGEYAPTADLISGESLPAYAAPYPQPDTCSVRPSVPPQNCTAYYPKFPLLGLLP